MQGVHCQHVGCALPAAGSRGEAAVAAHRNNQQWQGAAGRLYKYERRPGGTGEEQHRAVLRCAAMLCCAALWCGAGYQAAAIYGRLEVCVRLVEAGSPWPSGKGSKSGGGDVVALLTGSKLCKQRQLKVHRCVNTWVAFFGYTQERRGGIQV